MPSKISCFNRGVFLNDLRRWWPMTAGYALLWCLILPVERLTEYSRRHGVPDVWNMWEDSLNISVIGGYVSAFLTAILFAMAAFSYLSSARATNGLHALPARRETLFVTHYLAGLCSQLVPQALVSILTAAVLGAHGAFTPRVMGLMFLALALPTVFFYSFGVLCMVFTGQILAAPVFYGVLNVLAVSLEMLVRFFTGIFLYGWMEPDEPLLLAFSPIMKLLALDVRAVGANGSSGEQMAGVLVIRDMRWLWIYAAAGVVCAALALMLYRARRSEATGSVVAIYRARPIFKYGVSFCAALALGQLAYYIFFVQDDIIGTYSLAGLLFCMACAGLIGYFVAEMLLQKSFRVWKRGWRGATALVAALLALGAAMSLDLTGYENRVPALEAVERARVEFFMYGNNCSCFYATENPEEIRLIVSAHGALVRDQARQGALAKDGVSQIDPSESGSFSVDYRLKNGAMIRRRYRSVTLYENELADPNSPTAALTALYNDPSVTVCRVLDHWSSTGDPRKLSDLRFTGGYFAASKWDGDEYLGEKEHSLSSTDAQLLYDAVFRDIEAGRVSASLFEEEPGVMVTLYATSVDSQNCGAASRWQGDRTQTEFGVMVTPRMEEALAALASMGIEVGFRQR